MFKPGTKIEVSAEAIRKKYKKVRLHPQMTWKPATVIRAINQTVSFRVSDGDKTVWNLTLQGASNFRVPKS